MRILRGPALAGLCFALSACNAAAATSCFNLDKQSYCKVWSAQNDSMSKTEFLRSGETVDHWQRMVTIIRYNNLSSLQAMIPRYMATVSQYLGPNATPRWVAPRSSIHKQAVATRLLLSTPDNSDSEYVVAYFFTDPHPPAYAIIFSQHVPLPSGETPTMAQYGSWLTDLSAIVPASVIR